MRRHIPAAAEKLVSFVSTEEDNKKDKIIERHFLKHMNVQRIGGAREKSHRELVVPIVSVARNVFSG